jgi:hypothetical protein
MKHDCGCCFNFRPARNAETDEEYATMPGQCAWKAETNSANDACARHDCLMVFDLDRLDEDEDINSIGDEDGQE